MGTNYYSVLKSELPSLDPTINFYYSKNTYHIGKSSYGWVFSLHVIPDIGIIDLASWFYYLSHPDRSIIDENGNEISFEEMMTIIKERKRELPPQAPLHFYSQSAIMGPNNLIRSKIDGEHVVSWGDNGHGTWDCIVGEFT